MGIKFFLWEAFWALSREPLTGFLVSDGLDLGRISLELSQLLRHLVGGDNRARTPKFFKVSSNIMAIT